MTRNLHYPHSKSQKVGNGPFTNPKPKEGGTPAYPKTPSGCFYKGRVLFVGVLMIRALLFGGCVGAPDVWKLPCRFLVCTPTPSGDLATPVMPMYSLQHYMEPLGEIILHPGFNVLESAAKLSRHLSPGASSSPKVGVPFLYFEPQSRYYQHIVEPC